MDGLVMGDAVAEHMKVPYGVVHVSADSAPLDTWEGVAKAG